MGGIAKVFKGITKTVGGLLGQTSTPTVSIGTDPATIAAQTAQANLAADTSNANTPTVQAGGTVTSASDTLSARKRRTSTGVASNLGIGS